MRKLDSELREDVESMVVDMGWLERRRAFAESLKARKEGRAALEKARGETAALRNLANAARMVEQSPTQPPAGDEPASA
jgi:regulator of protease activity HflC (stomatin/prohibitin superfamily)